MVIPCNESMSNAYFDYNLSYFSFQFFHTTIFVCFGRINVVPFSYLMVYQKPDENPPGGTRCLPLCAES